MARISSVAAARRLDNVEGAAAARGRRQHLGLAQTLALPGELPYVGR